MERICFKSGLHEVTMDSDEVKKMYEDLHFLEQATLSILSEGIESDLDFDRETALKYLKEYFLKDSGYCNDFIKLVFSKLK